jgi:hypothetical protein
MFRAVLALPDDEGRGVLSPVPGFVLKEIVLAREAEGEFVVLALTVANREAVRHCLMTVEMNGGKSEKVGGHPEVSPMETSAMASSLGAKISIE